jgi:hypothetical protein
MHIFRHLFLIHKWWQKSDIWSQASYRYPISWETFLDPSDSYFLFADLVGFYTHWTYMHIFRHIFLSNYWWQKSERGYNKVRSLIHTYMYLCVIPWGNDFAPLNLILKLFRQLYFFVILHLTRCTRYSIMWYIFLANKICFNLQVLKGIFSLW